MRLLEGIQVVYMELKILFQDKYIIAAVKPPGVPSQPDKTGDADMASMLSVQEGVQRLFVVHRLDRPVGGVIVYAKTAEAAAALSNSIQGKQTGKNYFAVVCGRPLEDTGRLVDYLLKNERTNKSSVVPKGTKRAKEAILSYSLIHTLKQEEGILSLLSIKLETGRHHQIRVQLANKGIPIWGDTKYNQAFQKKGNRATIALWAASLSVSHPVTKKIFTFQEMPEAYPFSSFENI